MAYLQHRLLILLTFRGRHILAALIEALCAGDPFVLSRISMRRVVLRTEQTVAGFPLIMFMGLKFVLYYMEYAFFPFDRKIRRFSRMSVEQRIQYLNSWEYSRFQLKRVLFKLVKAACVCQIFSEKKLLKAIGYGPAMYRRLGTRPMGTYHNPTQTYVVSPEESP